MPALGCVDCNVAFLVEDTDTLAFTASGSVFADEKNEAFRRPLAEASTGATKFTAEWEILVDTGLDSLFAMFRDDLAMIRSIYKKNQI